MSYVSIRVTVSKILRPKQIVTSKGIEHEILEAKVAEEIGAMTLVLWNGKILPLKVGDFLRIGNGFVTPFKGEWTSKNMVRKRKFSSEVRLKEILT